MALEQRSTGYQDLVTNNNALLAVLKRKGPLADLLAARASGRRCKSPSKSRNGTQATISCSTRRIDLFNDAVFDPKMVVVPVILSNQEILNNEGTNQLLDVYEQYIAAAERSARRHHGRRRLRRRHRQRRQAAHRPRHRGSDRHQLRHLRRHRSRASSIWQTKTYDANLDGAAIGTQVTSTTIRPMLNYVMTKQSRGKDYADLLIMSPEHYAAYDAATHRHPATNQRDHRSASWASVPSNISAAASEQRSCSTAGSAPTCRPTPRSASTPTASAFAITRIGTSTKCSMAKA